MILASLALVLNPHLGPAVRPAIPQVPLQSLFRVGDYPKAALANKEAGATTVKITIGTTGRIEGCTVILSSGSALLDSTTCRILVDRARFQPGRDGYGAPTLDTYVTRIGWRLPGWRTAAYDTQ